MDLHSLHRPTPSTAQQRAEPPPSSIHAHTDNAARAYAENEKLRDLAAHWKRETEKMDKVARETMEKLDRKRTTKDALKAEFQIARRDADAWKTRYNELSAARSGDLDVSRARRELEGLDVSKARRELEGLDVSKARRELEGLDKTRRELDSQDKTRRELEGLDKTRRELDSQDKTRRELDEARSTLQRNESEREDIKKWLKLGGEAHRKAQALQTQLTELAARHKTTEADLTARHKTTEADLTARHKTAEALLAQAVTKGRTMEADIVRIRAQAVTSIRSLEAELAAAKMQAAAKTRQTDLDAAKTRQAESELVVARDKLRAATQAASARTAQAQASHDMLARAEQILQTCSSLHSAKDDTHPLAVALKETAHTVGQFLKQHEG